MTQALWRDPCFVPNATNRPQNSLFILWILHNTSHWDLIIMWVFAASVVGAMAIYRMHVFFNEKLQSIQSEGAGGCARGYRLTKRSANGRCLLVAIGVKVCTNLWL